MLSRLMHKYKSLSAPDQVRVFAAFCMIAASLFTILMSIFYHKQ